MEESEGKSSELLGDRAEREGFSLEAIFFDLVLAGVPECLIYGFHDGWDYDRLLRLFFHIQEEKIQDQASQAHCVSIGASGLLGGKGLQELDRHTKKRVDELNRRKVDFGGYDSKLDNEISQQDLNVFNQLLGRATKTKE